MMSYFNEIGRRIPTLNSRVFSDKPSLYYRLEDKMPDYGDVLERSKKFDLVKKDFSLTSFKNKADKIIETISQSDDYRNLLNGVHVPFIYQKLDTFEDLGTELEEFLLPNVKNSFNEKFPESWFKAVLQGNSVLRNNISIAENSNYEIFINKSMNEPVVGWYFPQALQEFDIASQRNQMYDLPRLNGLEICLAGGKDVCSAITAHPDLLISKHFYSPILCMSSYMHSDPRLILLIKSYGPHLEFWCMTQMLTKNETQVSEQWAGGISVIC